MTTAAGSFSVTISDGIFKVIKMLAETTSAAWSHWITHKSAAPDQSLPNHASIRPSGQLRQPRADDSQDLRQNRR
ncbi:hypothetical protein [Humibacter ginsengiterrae]